MKKQITLKTFIQLGQAAGGMKELCELDKAIVTRLELGEVTGTIKQLATLITVLRSFATSEVQNADNNIDIDIYA